MEQQEKQEQIVPEPSFSPFQIISRGKKFWLKICHIVRKVIWPVFSPFQIISREIFFGLRRVWDLARGWGTEGAEGAAGAEEVDQGEVSTIILGMIESSEFRKYSTLLVI